MTFDPYAYGYPDPDQPDDDPAPVLPSPKWVAIFCPGYPDADVTFDALAKYVACFPPYTMAHFNTPEVRGRLELLDERHKRLRGKFISMDGRCRVCGFRLLQSGHIKGQPCPDLFRYREQVEQLGWSIRQIAAFYDRSYSWVYERVTRAGIELPKRGRRPALI